MGVIQPESGKSTWPLLIVHSGKDILARPEGPSFLNRNIGSKIKQLKIYPDLYHEIFNEPEKDIVLSDMTDWLNQHISDNQPN